jgi:G3E family GTPase
LRSILWDSKVPAPDHGSLVEGNDHDTIEVHRLKARLPLSNGEVKIVQGVREVFEILDSPESTNSIDDVAGKIILIGRHLVDKRFEESFLNSIR